MLPLKLTFAKECDEDVRDNFIKRRYINGPSMMVLTRVGETEALPC